MARGFLEWDFTRPSAHELPKAVEEHVNQMLTVQHKALASLVPRLYPRILRPNATKNEVFVAFVLSTRVKPGNEAKLLPQL